MRLKEMHRTFDYAKRRTRKLPTHVRDAIFQNCVFLLSATLEDFIADVLTQWFNELLKQKATGSLMPEVTRLFLLARSMEANYFNYVADRDEVKLASKIGTKRHLLALVDGSQPIPVMDYREAVISDRSFPSTKNFDRLFGRVGIPKMSSKLNSRVKGDFLLALQSLMDVRNALAHEYPPPITDVDVKRHLKNLNGWINAIDREIFSHLVRVSGSKYWS